MKYTFYDQTHWELWSTVYTLYNITILVVTFLQAGNVSQMNIKKLAFEGDISIRLLSMLVIISSCYIFISTILMTAKNYYAATIVYAFGIMISHVIVISMIFLPKVMQIYVCMYIVYVYNYIVYYNSINWLVIHRCM